MNTLVYLKFHDMLPFIFIPFLLFSSVLSSQGGYIFKPQLVMPVKNSKAKSILGLLRKKVTVVAHLQML